LTDVRFTIGQKKDLAPLSPKAIYYEGTLAMKTKVLGIPSWKNRHFILENGELKYYKEKPTTEKAKSKPVEVFSISNCKFGPAASASLKYNNCFQMKNSGKLHFMSADSSSTLQKWKETIISAGGSWSEKMMKYSFIRDDGSVIEQDVEESSSNFTQENQNESKDSDAKSEGDEVVISKLSVLSEGPVFTDADGLAVVALNKKNKDDYSNERKELLIAEKGKDVAFIEDVHALRTFSGETKYLFHVFDDRYNIQICCCIDFLKKYVQTWRRGALQRILQSLQERQVGTLCTPRIRTHC
jgi:hypothetical protein